MTQHNSINVKLSNSQLKKWKSGIKNGTEVILNLSNINFYKMIDQFQVFRKILGILNWLI